jgi:cobalt-zinc-cadmium efflux system membrane fusion protein
MTRQDILNLASLACVAALTLWAGCRKGPEQTVDDGHGHGQAQAHTEVKDGVTMCTEHGVPEAQCGICKPELAGQLTAGEALKVRLPSAESARIVDIRTTPPRTGEISEGVECLAEVSFNQNRLAQIVAPVAGILQSVDVDLGTKVEERQTVARIWSASIA